jgi:hypothetical protein
VALGLLEKEMELFFGKAVDPLDLLLLPQLDAVIGHLATAALPVLAGGVGPPVEGAFTGVATVSLEKQLDIFASANPTVGTGILSQNTLPLKRLHK